MYNPTLYKIVVGGSQTGYLVHYFWIVVGEQWFVRPNKLEFTSGVYLTYFFTEFCVLLTVLLTQYIGKTVCGKKKRPKKLHEQRDL